MLPANSIPKSRPLPKELHVYIGMPSGGNPKQGFLSCLTGLLLKYTQYPVPGVKRIRLTPNTVRSSMLGHNRDVIVRNALRAGASHILWLDDDMTFPADTLSHLLRWRQPFVAAQGVTKQMPAEPVAMGVDGQRIWSEVHDEGLVEAQQVGLAVALTETAAIKRMRPPLFEQEYVPENRAPMGEDVFFCRKWREMTREKIWVDVGLSWQIGHIGEYEFGMKDVDMREKSNAA